MLQYKNPGNEVSSHSRSSITTAPLVLQAFDGISVAEE